MPTIILSKKELLKAVGKNLSDEKLADRISMLGTDLEELEGDDIHVEIFPNRPDMLSSQGFARALSSFIGQKTGLKKYPTTPSGVSVVVEKSVEQCRPFTACAIISGLKITEERLKEIIMVQEKLHVTYGRNRKKVAIGIYPMEHITPPIAFRGIEQSKLAFRPLEAESVMSAQLILDEHPKGKAYAHLVEGLEKYACFVDGADEIMSFTPIINSNHTGRVTEQTTKIFVECSGFEFAPISKCLNMIVTAFADMGGIIETCEVDYKHGKLGKIITPQLEPTQAPIDLNYVNSVLGLTLTEKEMGTYLEHMGYGYANNTVLVPAYRADILHQRDFIEDIAIAFGYENFTPTLPTTSTVGFESMVGKTERKLREILIGHGLLEMKNYHLVGKVEESYVDAEEIVTLKNSVSQGYDAMRKHLCVSLFSALARNKHHELPHRVFEIGSTFRSDGKKLIEERKVAIALAGEGEDYTLVRQILDDVARSFGLELRVKKCPASWLLDGRSGSVLFKDKTIGVIGEVHPQTITDFSLEVPISIFEISVAAFIQN